MARRALVAARPLVVLCALASLFAFSIAAVAQAEPPKLIFEGTFGTSDPHAVGVGVDGSGNLFVSSLSQGFFEPSAVVKLDPAGKLLSPPSPFGSAHYSGVAVSPANGDVYVLGEEGGGLTPPTPAMIFVYDPNTGALVSSFEVPASRQFFGLITDVQIAADSAGNVYVPNPAENAVLEYSSSGTLLRTFTGSGSGALNEPTGVAVDSAGDVWVADSANGRILEFAPGGAPVEVGGRPVEITSDGVWSLALDGHGNVFALVVNGADPCGEVGASCLHLVEYNAEGRQVADVGAGSFGVSFEVEEAREQRFNSMVAVNPANGRVYVTDGLKEKVWVFAPPTAPVVDKEFTAEVDVSEAKFGALVNPGGIPTSYRFEYGPTSAYGSSTPFPEGSVGEGVQSHAVWASASGLTAGTSYHYRVVATNELGTVTGPDQTFTTLTAEQAACPNEPLRGGFSARLPDCRAYELVTPPVTSGSQFDAAPGIRYASKAAADGEAVSLAIREPRPGAPSGGEHYVAKRGAAGWLAEDIMPLESYNGVGCQEVQAAYAFSDQLTKDVLLAGGGSRAASDNETEDPESCNPEGHQVVSGEPVGYENLLVRDNATGSYRLANVLPAGVTPADAHFKAASADASHVLFTETSPLAAGATYGVPNLYEWDEGTIRLVTVLPNGTPVPGSLAGTTLRHEPASGVSSDGSHVLFTYAGALYDRIDGQRTVQVDESHGGPGSSGGGSFQAATADGSKIFFLDESKLTASSTAEPGEPDLYQCDVPESASKCELTDVTTTAGGEHADVQRVIPLGVRDSSYVYFIAKGVLAQNTRQFTNSAGQTIVEGAEAGHENLYVWNGEKTTFIAVAAATPVQEGFQATSAGRFGHGQTSPDGRWLAFESLKSLTGYDNVAPNNENAGDDAHEASELFLYSAATGQLSCASCNPTGEPPVGGGGGEVGGLPRNGGGMPLKPETAEEADHPGVSLPWHLLTDAGQVFFDTTDALVPSDTNGGRDVYEYEHGGAHLISSGTSSYESNLEDVSESGSDVFFRSSQQLVPQDNQEGQIVIYDARVAGGFPASAVPPACTTADACRTPVPPQPSIYGAPASQTFSGLGNLTPSATPPAAKPKAKPVRCRRGFVRKKVKRKFRCVRKARRRAMSHKGGK